MVTEFSISLIIRLIALFVFAGVAVSDIRTRTAPNTAWVVLLGLGGLGLVVDSIPIWDIVGLALVVSVVSVVSVVAFRKGWIGGADAKAVMVLPIVFPRLPARDVGSGVFGTLLQGFEVVIVVSIVAGLVGLAWQLVAERQSDEGEENGVPFLVPIFVGVLVLFVA